MNADKRKALEAAVKAITAALKADDAPDDILIHLRVMSDEMQISGGVSLSKSLRPGSSAIINCDDFGLRIKIDLEKAQ